MYFLIKNTDSSIQIIDSNKNKGEYFEGEFIKKSEFIVDLIECGDAVLTERGLFLVTSLDQEYNFGFNGETKGNPFVLKAIYKNNINGDFIKVWESEQYKI